MDAKRAVSRPDALVASALALASGLAAVPGAPTLRAAASAVGAVGAFALARRLGRGASKAALVGLAYGLSGVLAEADGPLAAAPLLPWELVALELAAAGRQRLAPLLAGLGAAALLLAGPPGGAAAGSFAALAWAGLRFGRGSRERAIAPLLAGWLLAVSLRGLPALPAPPPSGRVDLLALGGIVALAGWIQVGWASSATGARAALLGAGQGLALALLASWLARRGLDPHAGELVLPGLGPPALSGPALPVPAWGLALVGLFAGARGLRGGGALAGAAGLATALALRAPGAADLWLALPGLGRIAPSAWSAPAALLTCLIAGAALRERSTRARWAAAAALLGLASMVAWKAIEPELPRALPELDPPDELVAYRVEARGVRAPDPGGALITGSVHPGLPASEVRLRIERLEVTAAAGGPPLVLRAPLADDESAMRPFRFETPERDAAFGPGPWLLTLEFVDRSGGELLGERTVAVLAGRPPMRAWFVAIGCALAAFALVVSPRARNPGIVLALTLAAGLASR